jgi:hypothetical protein
MNAIGRLVRVGAVALCGTALATAVAVARPKDRSGDRPEADSTVAAGPSASLMVARVDSPRTLSAREAFGARVASMAGEADRVDRVWSRFRSSCNVVAGRPRDGARGWFVVWQGSSIRADLPGRDCRDLFDQIIELGDPIRGGMTAAQDVARRSLSPADIREIRRRYAMDWDGWTPTSAKRIGQ